MRAARIVWIAALGSLCACSSDDEEPSTGSAGRGNGASSTSSTQSKAGAGNGGTPSNADRAGAAGVTTGVTAGGSSAVTSTGLSNTLGGAISVGGTGTTTVTMGGTDVPGGGTTGSGGHSPGGLSNAGGMQQDGTSIPGVSAAGWTAVAGATAIGGQSNAAAGAAGAANGGAAGAPQPRCGDGHIDPNESCDGPLTTPGFACTNTCTIERVPIRSRLYGHAGTGDDNAYSAVMLPSGDAILAGDTAVSEHGQDIWAVRFDSTLEMKREWIVSGSEVHNDAAYGVAADSTGGFHLAGGIGYHSSFTGGISRDRWIRSYSAAGDETWTWHPEGLYYPDYNDDYAAGIGVQNDGTLIATGKEYDGTSWDHTWIRAFDAAHEVRWEKTYSRGTHGEFGSVVAIDHESSRVAVAGHITQNSNMTEDQFWVSVFENDGTPVFELDPDDYAGKAGVNGLAWTSDHSLFVVSRTDTSNFHWMHDLWLLKLAPNGAEICQTTVANGNPYDPVVSESLTGVVADATGNAYAIGYAYQNGSQVLWFGKFDPQCTLLWSWTHAAAEGWAQGRQILWTATGNLLLVGREQTASNGVDIWLAEMAP